MEDEGVSECVPNLIVAKVVMLGSAGVGKSCLVHRIIHDAFSEHSSTTVGANHHTHMLRIGDDAVEMRLWDTAGQERFRSFVPLYFRDAAAAVVVFDMTDRDSYNDARGWVDMVRNEAGPEVHIFLVGGKSDLKDSRTVLADMVKAYASEQSIAYVEASALSGENVAQLFMLVGKQVIESRELLERKAAESAQSKKLDDKPPQARGGCKC